jgi:hypothetical protein
VQSLDAFHEAITSLKTRRGIAGRKLFKKLASDITVITVPPTSEGG